MQPDIRYSIKIHSEVQIQTQPPPPYNSLRRAVLTRYGVLSGHPVLFGLVGHHLSEVRPRQFLLLAARGAVGSGGGAGSRRSSGDHLLVLVADGPDETTGQHKVRAGQLNAAFHVELLS